MPYIGKGANGFGIRETFQYTATSGQQAFTSTDINSKTLSFDNGSLVDVLLNGITLKPTTDYNTSTANTITLTSGASASDEVMIIVYDVFSLSDAMPKTGGTFSGALSGVDVNGTELILDADGDTSITADTDDSIDFKTSGTDRVNIDSAGHVQVETGSLTINTVGQVLGVGTNNPSHAIQVHHTAPEIMLEETSSGGSKRISMGVKTDGTPFISAEQSGAFIDFFLAGSHTARMTSTGAIFQNPTSSAELLLKANVSSGSGTPQFAMFRSNTRYAFVEAGVNSTATGGGNHMVILTEQGDLFAKDSDGNNTQLSPHNFDYIPDGASEVGAWCYRSENLDTEIIKDEEGEKIGEKVKSATFISADMTKVVRQVEKLTGEKLIYKGTLDVDEDGEVSKHTDDGSTVKDNIIADLIKRIEVLEKA